MMIVHFRWMTVVMLMTIATQLTGCPAPSASSDNAATTTPKAMTLTSTQPPEGIGLNERRSMEVIEKESIPSYEADLKTACPDSNIKILMDWASFGTQTEAYTKFAESPRSDPYNRGFGSAINAIGEVCRDDLGKKAIAQKLQAMKLVHVAGLAEGRGEVANGVLVIETDVTQADKQPGITVLKELLEKQL
jgi:hypothetical protein